MKKTLLLFFLSATMLLTRARALQDITVIPYVTAGPLLLVNTDSVKKSSPSQIKLNIGGGADIKLTDAFSLEGGISFFTNYYLWDGENAQPAEVENRSASVMSFLFDFTGVYTHSFSKNILQAGGGAGILARYAIQASGTDSSDKDATDKINSWVWSDGRYFYPELFISWMYDINPFINAGLEGRVYFPLSFIQDFSDRDELLARLALKIQIK